MRLDARAETSGAKLKVPPSAAAPAKKRRVAVAGTEKSPGIRERNRQRILKAAEKVFAKKGFDGATTAEIARLADLPKANLHYYFRTKEELYRTVVENILLLWLAALDKVHADADPEEAIAGYIKDKMAYSRDRPDASRIFAIEVLGGGHRIAEFLKRELPRRVREKGTVLAHWAASGKMDPVNPAHFLFLIWAATQHYADFAAQIAAVYGKSQLDAPIFAKATESLTGIILKGCGISR